MLNTNKFPSSLDLRPYQRDIYAIKQEKTSRTENVISLSLFFLYLIHT